MSSARAGESWDFISEIGGEAVTTPRGYISCKSVESSGGLVLGLWKDIYAERNYFTSTSDNCGVSFLKSLFFSEVDLTEDFVLCISSPYILCTFSW